MSSESPHHWTVLSKIGIARKYTGVIDGELPPCGILPWRLGPDSELSVPKARMMCADVSEIAEK
jgi:hypothetical protein